MQNQKRKFGKIIVPKGALPLLPELLVAEILARDGEDVEFIPVRTVPTPDILYAGEEWEIKSPVGKTSRTIENNLRNALKQSANIIVDLSRIKQPEQKAIKEIKRQARLLRGIGKVIIVTKTKEMIKIC